MPKLKDRIIIDTNLWLSFLITKDYAKLDTVLYNKFVILLYSQQLIDEFIEVAQRPKFRRYFSNNDLQELLLSMSQRSHFIEVITTVEICRDQKDNFLLALAKDGNASHLLTGDKDLLSLKKFGRTKILTLVEYLLTQ
jgi:putative PIN family toxin of toxin-antitoxin system